MGTVLVGDDDGGYGSGEVFVQCGGWSRKEYLDTMAESAAFVVLDEAFTTVFGLQCQTAPEFMPTVD